MSTDPTKTMDDLLAERAALEEKASLEEREKLDGIQEAVDEEEGKGPAKPRKGIHIWQNSDGSITVTPIKELDQPNLYDMLLMGTFVVEFAKSQLTAEATMRTMHEAAKNQRVDRLMANRPPGMGLA